MARPENSSCFPFSLPLMLAVMVCGRLSVASAAAADRREYIQQDGTVLAIEEAAVASVSGDGCAYSVSPANRNLPISGGSGTVAVNAGVGCLWAAESNVSWMTITSGESGVGNGTIDYSVVANLGSARNETITAGEKTFTVSQAAANICQPRCEAEMQMCQMQADGCVNQCAAQIPNCVIFPAACMQAIQGCVAQCQSQTMAVCASQYNQCMASCK